MSSFQSILVVTLLLWSLNLVDTDAFSVSPTRSSLSLKNVPQKKRISVSKCWAKPPPTTDFDLDAIEEFEAQLDLSPDNLESEACFDDEDKDDEVTVDSDNIKLYTIPHELDNKRIDAALAALEPTLSRSACGNMLAEGQVRLVEGDEFTVLDRKAYKVRAGITLRVAMPVDEKPVAIVAQDLPLDILYEDEQMIVLNKAAGMVVHPAAGNWDGTVVNALAFYLAKSPHGSGDFVGADGKFNKLDEAKSIEVDGTEGETVSFRPGIVHRLDKGTTGILVVAKTTRALSALSAAFAARKVKKTYLAVTVGNPGKRVTIDKPIGRHPMHRQRMRVVPDPHKRDSSGMAPKDRMAHGGTSLSQQGRRALSYVDTLAFDGKLSVVQVRIETGRTHQIRVHLQDRHTPIYGDDVYGLADWNKRLSKTHAIARPLLHAHRLELDHPLTGEHMVFMAPMAEDMTQLAQAVWPQGKEEQPELFQ
jgi:23S rRNA pseudouridine1911/1915/1917 synthase